MEKNEIYEQALQHEARFEDSIAPDGCFYCGVAHPSDCCVSDDRREYWASDDDE